MTSAPPLSPGQRLDGYVVEERLGVGGMGEVWRGRDPALGRPVAIKVLRADRAAPSLRARFVVEGKAAAALAHPAVVTVYGAGEVDGLAYLAMELVEGTTLRQAMPAAPLGQRIVWLERLADALAAVHRAGFVHRDVKPSNVMITRGGDVKLLDFGLVRPPPELGSLTRTGQVLGTPRYFAPEQFLDARVDARADQFAWALVAFEALSGRHPDDVSVGFGRGPSWVAAARPLCSVAPEVPAAVAAVVDRALSRDPAERFASMQEIVSALGAALAEPGAPPVALAGTTVVEAPRSPAARAPRRKTAPAVVFLAAMLVAVVSLTVVGLVLVVRGDVRAPARVAPPPEAPSAPVTSEVAPPPSPAPPSAAPPAPPVASTAPSTPPRPLRASAASASASASPAGSSSGRSTMCRGPFGSLAVDTSDFTDTVPAGARAAWQSAMTQAFTACIRAVTPSMCVGDAVNLFVVLRPGSHEVGPMSAFGAPDTAFPSRSCLSPAVGRAVPTPAAVAKGWVRLTVEPP